MMFLRLLVVLFDYTVHNCGNSKLEVYVEKTMGNVMHTPGLLMESPRV